MITELLQKIADQEKTVQTQRDTIEALSGQLVEAQQDAHAKHEAIQQLNAISRDMSNILGLILALHVEGKHKEVQNALDKFIQERVVVKTVSGEVH